MKSSLSHLIVACLCCISAVIGYGMWYSALSEKSATVANVENNIRAKTETAKRIAATRTALAGVENEEAVVRSYFVLETGVVAFIDVLQAQGKKQGAVVSVLSVSTEGAPAQSSLTLSLTAKGTFDAIMRTVGAIEYVPYDLSISKLMVTQDAKNSWHADFTLLVGSLPATSGTTDTPAATIHSPTTHAFF